MSTTPSWLEVTVLIEAYSDSSLIPDRVREWRGEKKWPRRELAEQLTLLATSTGHKDYALAEPAIVKIENHSRVVSLGEAIGLARVFGKTLAELVLPAGALEEADDWRLFEEAAEDLNTIRNATFEYEHKIAQLRNRMSTLPHLRAYVERELVKAKARVEREIRQAYDKRLHVQRISKRIATEQEPLQPYDEWREGNSIAPTPKQVAAEHALGDEKLDHNLWYLGWNAKYVRDQFRWRQQAKRRKAKSPTLAQTGRDAEL